MNKHKTQNSKSKFQNLKGYASFSDKLKTEAPQTGQPYKKIAQRIKKRPTDKTYQPLIKLYVKIKLLNPLVVFPSVEHKKKLEGFTFWILIFCVLILSLGLASAQELEPRAYSNAPVGMNFVAATYGLSRGNIIVDASLPVEDFRVTAHGVGAAYVRTLNFFGMHGKVQALLPFTWLSGNLKIAGRDTSGTRTGFADARFRVAMNFIGAPALAPREFRNYQQKTVAGASLVIAIPIGQYDKSKRVNLGSNRWAFKPELGVSQRIGKWYLETFGGVWLFMDNTKYLNTSTLEQKPLFTVQGHVSYVFKPGLWLAVNGGYADGGETSVGGSFKSDFQKNWRIGATFAAPLGRQHALKVLANSGTATRAGSDFDALMVAYQYSWLGEL